MSKEKTVRYLLPSDDVFDLFSSGYGPSLAMKPYSLIPVENNLVVADIENARLIIFNSAFEFKTEYTFAFGSGAITSSFRHGCYSSNKLFLPHGTSIKIYDVTVTGGEISNITYNGTFGSSGSGDGQFTTACLGVCTDGTNLFAVDQGGHRIQKFTMAGEFVAKVGSQGSGDDQFDMPGDISYQDGKLYVAEINGKRVNVRQASDLSYLAKFGSSGPGDGQFRDIYGITTDANYIYTAEYASSRSQKFDISTYAYSAKIEHGSGVVAAAPFQGELVIGSVFGTIPIRRVQISDMTSIATIGTVGAGPSLPFSPVIQYPSGHELTMYCDWGQSVPIASDTPIPTSNYYGIIPPTSAEHHYYFIGCRRDEISILSSEAMPTASAWALYQETPVMSFGAFGLNWYELATATYHCYYAYDSYTKIGHATSADGITWTNDTAHNPVLVIGPGGTYDQVSVAVPNVWKEDATWYMLYRGNGSHTCLATSEDGLVWTKYVSNPVIASRPDPAGIIKVESTYYLFCNTTGGNRSIYVYTSDDLHTWTPQTPSPLMSGGRFCSCPFKWNGKYYLLVSKYQGGRHRGGMLELFESDSPTFSNIRYCGMVVNQPTKDSVDTPTIATLTINRDTFPSNQLQLWFSMGGPTYYMYYLVQPDISAAIASAIPAVSGNTIL